MTQLGRILSKRAHDRIRPADPASLDQHDYKSHCSSPVRRDGLGSILCCYQNCFAICLSEYRSLATFHDGGDHPGNCCTSQQTIYTASREGLGLFCPPRLSRYHIPSVAPV